MDTIVFAGGIRITGANCSLLSIDHQIHLNALDRLDCHAYDASNNCTLRKLQNKKE